MSEKEKTPTGIKLLVVLQIIGGLFLIGFPCFLALRDGVMNIMSVLTIGLGVGTIFLAKALLALKKWAWYLNTSLYGLAVSLIIAEYLISLLYDPSLFYEDPSFVLAAGFFRTLVPLSVTLYLFSVRKHFGIGATEAREEKEVKT